MRPPSSTACSTRPAPAIASRPLRLSCRLRGSQARPHGMCASFVPTGPRSSWGREVTVAAWPISLSAERATALRVERAPAVADFGELSLEALTPFVAFAVHVQTPEVRAGRSSFVVNLPIDGEPAGREALVLRQMLRHPARPHRPAAAAAGRGRACHSRCAVEARPSKAPRRPGRPSAGAACSRRWCATWPRPRTSCAPSSDSSTTCGRRSPLATPALSPDEPGAEHDTEAISLIPPGFEEIWQPIWQTARQLGVGRCRETTAMTAVAHSARRRGRACRPQGLPAAHRRVRLRPSLLRRRLASGAS